MKQLKQWMRLLLVLALPAAAAEAAPGLMSYQGRLTDTAGTAVTTATAVTFTYWDGVSGGVQLGAAFSDTDSVTPDSQGLFSTDIGDDPDNLIPRAIFDNDAVWLNMNVGGSDLAPRIRVTSAAYAVDADKLQGFEASAFLKMSADAFVIVQTTASATQNGTNLLAVYAAAKALTPNGEDRTTTNRAAVVVPPAHYDRGAASLTMDTGFVDLLGLTTARDAQYIFSSGNVLVQTTATEASAVDVRIENLTLYCSATDYVTHAYHPKGGSPAATTIRNCNFQAANRSMLVGVEYGGTYEDCVAGDYAFGAFSGTASGTFTNCTGGYGTFGGGGTASGTFTNCIGGDIAFGGYRGTASGTFTDCTGGAYAFGGYSGTAGEGKFYHCVGGSDAFTESGVPAPVQLFCVREGAQYPGNN